MKNKTLLLVLTCLALNTAVAQQPKVTPLLSRDLKEVPGREKLTIIVDFPPGGAEEEFEFVLGYACPIHRHNAHGFIYVLEGSVVMQVKGGKEVTLTAGHTFYESPDDVHVVGRNASTAKPARILAFLVKNKDAPPWVLVK